MAEGSQQQSGSAAPVAVPPVSQGYARYALWLLWAIFVLNFLDRQVLNILAEDIKLDLKLTDTQLGLLGGLAFALLYSILGIPIARMAERTNRARIISVAVVVWSGFTALCATVTGFWQLVFYRVGVGIGEAGCTPPAHALISDYFPKEKRASALAFYASGTPIGALLGLVMGGLVADALGWRAAFLIAAAPGLVLAAAGFLTLREPRQHVHREKVAHAATSGTFRDVLRVLARKRTFWLITAAASIQAFIGFGHGPFQAPFFLRTYPDQIAALADGAGALLGIELQSRGFLGLALGLTAGATGAIGAIVGGHIADRLAKIDLRTYMALPALASLAIVPIYIYGIMQGTAVVALTSIAVAGFLGALCYGPLYATTQSVVPIHMRATAAAVLLFVINLVGLGLGPLAVGALSDAIANHFLSANGLDVKACLAAAGGDPACQRALSEGVRWALAIPSLAGIAEFACFWWARRTIREDMVS